MVLRAKRLIRVLRVKCLRSMACVFFFANEVRVFWQNRRAKRDNYKPSAVRVTQRYVP
ncbi:hypothetical protein [Piscirickettsia salmonis]|uniref:hypothetical protein n=1 Tax=Piscirickettsia salmonis TaxID=1238 RepID=UPI0018AC9DD0